MEPFLNIFAGTVSASITGAGFYLARQFPPSDLLLSLSNLTSFVASPILAFLAANKIPATSHAKHGAILSGIILGGATAVNPETIVKNFCCLVTITGISGYLTKFW